MRGVVGVVILTSGCLSHSDRPTARDNPTGVVDTAGTAFAWQCDDDGCRVAMDATTPRAPACEDDEVAGYGYAAAHFLSIMSACNNTWLEQWERPIACQRDADCPQLYEFSTDSRFECRNGLCQNIDIAAYPTDAIGYFDAFLLCIAPVARTETIEPGTSVTIDVTARVNAACTTPGGACTLPLPPPCLNP